MGTGSLYRVCVLIAFWGVVAGCGAGEPAEGPAGASITVEVAALELPGVNEACYSLAVSNEAGQPVWSRANLCASRYGSGADISYVAPCDATDVDGGGAMNTVTLTIDGLSTGVGGAGASIEDFIDPCAAPHNPDGCQLEVACAENADSRVVFNLTLMRQADQGFFDLAVNFSDIFCSAKVDCVDAGSDPLELVHDPETGRRVASVVMALACTDGSPPGAEGDSTHLYREPVQIVCDGTTWSVDPSEGPGNLYPGGVGAPPPLVQAMVFEGVEALANGGAPADKLFWNVALGLDVAWFQAQPAVTSCRLQTRMTASGGPLAEGTIGADQRYPYIVVDVPLWSTGPNAAPLCARHPLNGAPAGVATAYTRPDEAPTDFRYVGRQVGGVFESAALERPFICAMDVGCQPGEVQLVSVRATGLIDVYSDLANAPLGEPFTVSFAYDVCAQPNPYGDNASQYVQNGDGAVAIFQFGWLRKEGPFTQFLANDFQDWTGYPQDLYQLQSLDDGSTMFELSTTEPHLDFRTSDRLECTGPVFDGLALQTNFARVCDSGGCAEGTITAVALGPLLPPPPPPVCDPPCDNGSCIATNQCQCDLGYMGATCSTPLCAPPCAHGDCAAPGLCDCDESEVGGPCTDSTATAWIRTFGSAAQDYGINARMLVRSHRSTDGHFIAAGGTSATDSDGDAYLVELDAHGNLLASRTYGGPAADGFSGVIRFGAGYAACGSSSSYNGSGHCVILGPDLGPTSSGFFGSTNFGNVNDLVSSSSTELITVGNSTDTDPFFDIVVRNHGTTGAEAWKRVFGRSRDDTAINVLAFADGSHVLTGFSGGWAACQQYYALKFDSSGTKLWDRAYGDCSAGNQMAAWNQMRQAVATSDGGFIATGSTVIGGARSVFLEKFAADGVSQWRKTYGGAGNEWGVGLTATADGGYVIVGWTNSFGAGGDDIYVIKTSADGTLVWQRTYGGAANDQGLSILQMTDGGFMLGGTTSSWGAGGADLVVIRTDALGNAPGFGL